ncbi:MAG: hypothetical protein ACK493_08485 [Planctomycetota bacterium]|nr:hypothetical protein [Blastopirellula sp.]
MGKLQQHLLGLIAFSLVAISIVALWSGSTQPLFAIMLRVGFGLLAIWLAWPQLMRGEWKGSLLVAAILVGLVVLLAARPRYVPVIGGILILAGAIQLGLRYASRMLGRSSGNRTRRE